MERKVKSFLIVVTTIICVVLLELIGFEVYNNYIKKDTKVEETTKVTQKEETKKKETTNENNKLTKKQMQEIVKDLFITSYLRDSSKSGLLDYKIENIDVDYFQKDDIRISDYNLSDNALYAAVEYSVKVDTSSQETFMNWAAGNGEWDGAEENQLPTDGWIHKKYMQLAIDKDSHGVYYISTMGTGL